MGNGFTVLKRIGIAGAALALVACGSGGAGSSTTAASDETNNSAQRTIKGSLTGDVSSVSGVRARSLSDNVSYDATIETVARSNGLTGSGATFTITVPTGKSYHIEAVDESKYVVGTVTVPSGSGTNTTTIPITGGTTSVDVGAVTLPAGTDASHHAELETEHNPLHDVDSDDDGIDNYNDADDDGDGIDDSSDSDSDGDGIDDSAEESDDSSDDSSDGPGHDANDDIDDHDDDHDDDSSQDSSSDSKS